MIKLNYLGCQLGIYLVKATYAESQGLGSGNTLEAAEDKAIARAHRNSQLSEEVLKQWLERQATPTPVAPATREDHLKELERLAEVDPAAKKELLYSQIKHERIRVGWSQEKAIEFLGSKNAGIPKLEELLKHLRSLPMINP